MINNKIMNTFTCLYRRHVERQRALRVRRGGAQSHGPQLPWRQRAGVRHGVAPHAAYVARRVHVAIKNRSVSAATLQRVAAAHLVAWRRRSARREAPRKAHRAPLRAWRRCRALRRLARLPSQLAAQRVLGQAHGVAAAARVA